jgi:dephospho-CoA kinase
MLVSIAIDSSSEARFERIMNRKREDDMITLEKLHERDTRELGWGMGEAIAASDRIIENKSTLEEYQKSIRRLFEEMIAEESQK